jgi:hypothetical protein
VPPEQFSGQVLGRPGANLPALAALAGGDGEDLAGDPVGTFIFLAFDLDCDGVTRWGLVHHPSTSSEGNR